LIKKQEIDPLLPPPNSKKRNLGERKLFHILKSGIWRRGIGYKSKKRNFEKKIIEKFQNAP